MKKIISLALILACLEAGAQSISYRQYIQTVASENIEYLAERYNVDIATANLQAAKVFNDPELSVDYANNQDWFMYMGQSVELGLSYDLDLAGERRARIRAAASEKEITDASVAAYLSNLRLDAATAWAEAWSLRCKCEVMEESVDDMMRIAESDSIRLSLGDISRADATQSRLEAQSLKAQLISLRSEYENALMGLSSLCGGRPVTDISDENLPLTMQDIMDGDIYTIAEMNRADLKAAELSHTLSNDNLALVKASRAFDMGLNVGYSYNTEVRNEIAPAPKFNGISVGVTIPLKFSGFNRGELKAAQSRVLQSQKYYESAVLQVRTEVSQALNSLRASEEVMRQYDDVMLAEAREVMESRCVGYAKGESSLLELLSAQAVYRDVMTDYIDACRDNFICHASLEHALGISAY